MIILEKKEIVVNGLRRGWKFNIGNAHLARTIAAQMNSFSQLINVTSDDEWIRAYIPPNEDYQKIFEMIENCILNIEV